MCVNFEDEILLRVEKCKTWENKKFQENDKIIIIIIIIIINYQNGSGKPRKFSRSRITKRTALLDLSSEI